MIKTCQVCLSRSIFSNRYELDNGMKQHHDYHFLFDKCIKAKRMECTFLYKVEYVIQNFPYLVIISQMKYLIFYLLAI